MEWLKYYREKAGLSMNDLSEVIGVKLNTIWRWENGKASPSIDMAKILAHIFNITETELLNGPTGKQTRLVVTYDWSKYEEGGIAMDDNGFELILGSQGQIGLKGAGKLTSREAMEEFLARVRLQVETAFEAQVKRGAIQLA